MGYRYEKGEHRHKHAWNHDYPGFSTAQGHLVGKCPNNVSQPVAEALLNQAVAEPDPFVIPGEAAARAPTRLYGVYKGAIYEAVSSGAGSYHAYPWRARRGRPSLPQGMLEKLEKLATKEGYLDEFREWIDQYGTW